MNKGDLKRILIVEDNADSAESLKFLLEINNYSVRVAADSESGLQAARLFLPHIIICDIGLPGRINGFDLAKIFKQDEELKSAYLIALSGYGQAEDVSKAKTYGFDTYVVKPADFDKLIKLIDSVENT